ncbi:MAG: VOC family protein [Dysgonomonas sp.]|nr:VOC family protein [Dysgonomonas sp.]
MKNLEPYLIFNGECAEAFSFYASVFNAEPARIMKYKELPEGKENIAPEDMEKVVHALLHIGNNIRIMGADMPSNMKSTGGENIYLTMNVESEAEAKHLYESLSKGGNVEMPLQKTFWADLYASFTDRFGIGWMVNYYNEQK